MTRSSLAGILLATMVPGVLCANADAQTPTGTPIVHMTNQIFCQGQTVGDLDGDGTKEIVAVAGLPETAFVFGQNPFSVFVFNQDGSVRNGWPVLISPDLVGVVGDHPALADLDQDGRLEIIINEVNYPPSLGHANSPYRVHAFREDGTVMPGWPIALFPQAPETKIFLEMDPVVADLDLDGRPEVLVTVNRYAGPALGRRIHAFRHDGSPVPGWPVNLPGESRFMVAVGNVDASPTPEVMTSDVDGRFHVLSATGQVLRLVVAPGGSSDLWRHPCFALANLDGDAAFEIVYNNCNSGHQISVFNGDGTMLPGWPQSSSSTIFTGSTALGDLDRDGRPEIVAMTQPDVNNTAQVYVFRRDGTALPAAPMVVPVRYGFGAAPILADVDMDRVPEIVYAGLDTLNFQTLVYAFDVSGQLEPQYPIVYTLGEVSALTAYPSVTDFDSNGGVDISVATGNEYGSGTLYSNPIPSRYHKRTCPWPQFAGNSRNNAVFVLQ